MNLIKRCVINGYYRLKYRRSHLKLDRGALILDWGSLFEGHNRIGENSSFHGKMGYCSYIGRNSHLNAVVGKYCCISDCVRSVSGTHPSHTYVSIHPAFYSTLKQCGCTYVEEDCFDEVLRDPVDGCAAIYIGNDVWIGCDVTLIGGIKIGDGAIIAAGAVVTHDVEPYTIVGGVPAKPIRKRFTQEQIEYLQQLRWWDKETLWLKKNHCDFRNIESFIEKHPIGDD